MTIRRKRFLVINVWMFEALDSGAVLYDHFKALKENMEALEVACTLKKNKVLDSSSYEKIVHMKARRMRVDALIKALYEAMHCESGNIKVYTEFVSALKLTDQQDVINILQTKMTPYKPMKYENETLLKMFEEKRKVILNEIEPLDVIDDVVVFRRLHLHDHEEIQEANSRKHRVDLLCKHLKTLPKGQAWRILKPIKETYKGLFADISRQEKTTSVSSSASTSSSSKDSPSASPSSDSGVDGPSMALSVNFSPTRKHSIAIPDSTEHDHPTVKLEKTRKKLKELEKKAVESVNNDPERYKAAFSKMMEDCTSSVKSLSFSSIRINLQASSDTSVEQLKEFCRDGRAKSLILSLLDGESIQKLKELEATRASLDLYVDEKKGFIHIIDEVGEGCLCTLTSVTVERHFDYVAEHLEDLEIPLIDKVLKIDVLDETQAKELLKIKGCENGKERRRKLLEFLLGENACQILFCILENEILMSGEAEILLRIQQTKPCKVSASKNTYSREARQITVPDLREHAELLEEELDGRWFLHTLKSRTDERSLQMVKQSRTPNLEKKEPSLS